MPSHFVLIGSIRRCWCGIFVRDFRSVDCARGLYLLLCFVIFLTPHEITGGTVQLVQKLTSARPTASENFGEDVSIESGRLAVGAPNPIGVSYANCQ